MKNSVIYIDIKTPLTSILCQYIIHISECSNKFINIWCNKLFYLQHECRISSNRNNLPIKSYTNFKKKYTCFGQYVFLLKYMYIRTTVNNVKKIKNNYTTKSISVVSFLYILALRDKWMYFVKILLKINIIQNKS